jgi:predicted Zn-dependent peptidase
MEKSCQKYVLNNGMTVLAEPIEAISSVSFSFLLPAGASRSKKGNSGVASVASDLIFRGAGKRNTRELSDTMDSLGLQRTSNVTASHINLASGLEASKLLDALAVYADVIREPWLREDQFELSKQLSINELLSLDDNPRQKVMLELYERYYPQPMGRSPMGRIHELQGLAITACREFVKSNFNPAGTILAVSGKYDFDKLCKTVEKLFANEKIIEQNDQQIRQSNKGYSHIQYDGAQVHIGLMCGAANTQSEDYYNARVAASILSGGMSSRLFTEVREKRGLCYAVGARYHNIQNYAGIGTYAGTTPDKAQETADVIVAEMKKLKEHIDPEEIKRAKIGLKSSVIMHSESTKARASGIAKDYFLLGRVRTLEEIKENIEKTTIDSIIDYLERNPFEDFTAVTIGPKEINVSNY